MVVYVEPLGFKTLTPAYAVAVHDDSCDPKAGLAKLNHVKTGKLLGSWVVTSGVISRVTILLIILGDL